MSGSIELLVRLVFDGKGNTKAIKVMPTSNMNYVKREALKQASIKMPTKILTTLRVWYQDRMLPSTGTVRSCKLTSGSGSCLLYCETKRRCSLTP